MAKKLVDGTNIIIEENADNINMNLSSTYTNALNQTINNSFRNNNVYSTTETVIGIYRNKPLYRIVKDIGNLPNNTRKEVSYDGILDTTVEIRKIYGTAKRVTDSIIDWVNLKDLCSLLLYRSSSKTLFVDTSEDRSAYTAEVIFEYTKTTD